MKPIRIHPKRLFAGALVTILTATMCFSHIPAVTAAEVGEATIHPERPASITLYKFDMTNAAKDGVWSADSYVSTGQYDANINDILGNAVRKGASGTSSALGNGGTSNGYAIAGCGFDYLRVADVYQYSQPTADETASAGVEVLYAFNKESSADFLSAIGLSGGAQSHEAANNLPGNEGSWYYRSDVLNRALEAALNDNATVVKNALEAVVHNGGSSMPLTDANGRSYVSDLPVGLYLLVETVVPEMVTDTTSPFLLSLPSTTVNGGGDDTGANTGHVTDGGHAWLYDLVVYPKNETGIPSLEKEVRESHNSGGKHNGTDQIGDGFDSNATASTGDTLDYQILSTLPTITSDATKLTAYNFFDTVSSGLTYNKDVQISFYTDKECTDLVTTWSQDSGKFNVSYTEDNLSMTVDITAEGLAEINGDTSNVNGKLYRGYSNYTAKLTYTATLNSNAETVVGDNANRNKVVLTWRRTTSDHMDTLADDTHVYTFGLDLVKQFSDLESGAAADKQMFDEVKFKIFNSTDQTWITAALSEDEGIYYVNGYADESGATIFHPTTVAGKPGQLVVRGLEDDEYIITEVETADGYTLLMDSINVTITASDDPSRPCDVYSEDLLGLLQNDSRYQFSGEMDLRLAGIPQKQLAHNMLTGSATVDGNKTTMIPDRDSANALATLTVINTRGFDLPSTGDNGTRLLPIAGAIFMCGAAVLGGCIYLGFRKKSSKDA